jgi:hypothetical protein
VCLSCVPASCRLRFALCRSPAFPRFPSCAHTWLRPHATVWALCVRAGGGKAGLCGRVCSRVAGVWCLRLGCVRVGVCVLACVRSLGGGGTVWSRRPSSRSLPSGGVGFWCSRAACGRAPLCAKPPWVRGVTVWGGTIMSRPMQRGAGLPLVAPWRGERGVACGVLSWCANTRAHTRREMGEKGSHVGRTVVAWAGAGVVVALACSPLGAYKLSSWWRRGEFAPFALRGVVGDSAPWWRVRTRPRGSKIGTIGRGRVCAPGRGGCPPWGDGKFVMVALWWWRFAVVTGEGQGAGLWTSCAGRGLGCVGVLFGGGVWVGVAGLWLCGVGFGWWGLG